MEHADTAQLAALAGALGAVLVLLARGRWPLLAGLVVLLVAEVALVSALGPAWTDRLDSAAGVAAGGAGVVAVVAAAWAFARWPAAVPVAVLLAAPFRPPLDFSSDNEFLVSIASDGRLGRLLPLYFVLGAAALALAWRAARGAEVRALPSALAWPAAAFFAFAFVSLQWATDVEAGTNLLLFFTLPFTILLAVVARAAYPAWVPRSLGIAAIALAAIFAAVGLWQAATHELFFYAPNLAVSNANTDFFRVTSLFGDPSLYGRHVLLGMAVVLALLATRRSNVWLLLGLLALMWLGLLFSYSQSSMVALVVVTLAVAVATGDRQVRTAVAALAVVGVLGALAFVGVRLIDGGNLNQITSDRTDRVEQTLRVVEDRPFVGVGVGGQPRASRDLEQSDRPTPAFVSHTTPLTVFAELGAVGLALYLWLLFGVARVLAGAFGRDRTLGLALGACFLGLFVHALFYSGFLEDPLTWLVAGVAAGWLTAQPPLPRKRRDAAAAA